MKYLYKYPQREYPYCDLVEKNRVRSREEFEYELLDTGIFNNDRYFDIFVEYAKNGPEDVLVKITVHNRGPKTARLRLLPTLWFRNRWSWGEEKQKPILREVKQVAQKAFKVQYLPAEFNTGMFGGNSNWRGPVWMPVNILIVRALLNLYQFYGEEFKVECPTGSGQHMTLFEVAKEISQRLKSIFIRIPMVTGLSMGKRLNFKKTHTGVI